MLILNYGGSTINVARGLVIAIGCIAIALIVGFYLLRSIGLYKLAKRHGVDKAFMAWIPYVWIFVVCKLIKESNIFGFSFNKFAWLFTLLAGLAGVLPLVKNFIDFFPYIFFYLEGGTVILESTSLGIYLSGVGMVNHFDTNAMAILTSILSKAGSILGLITMIIEVTAFICLFKKFWPEHYILAAVLSAMGLFAPFVFAIRKRRAINFAEYIANRYYRNPYGPNPYGAQNVQREKPENPFGEFDNKKTPEDPFEEFNGKGKN